MEDETGKQDQAGEQKMLNSDRKNRLKRIPQTLQEDTTGMQPWAYLSWSLHVGVPSRRLSHLEIGNLNLVRLGTGCSCLLFGTRKVPQHP